jgi:CubicO group peptidase (beta-lactamase class C family)
MRRLRAESGFIENPEMRMSKLKVRAILTFLSCVCFLTVSEISISAEISAELEANILRRIERRFFPGLIIGIVDEQGSRYYGYGEVTLKGEIKPDKDTVYEIGSITKTFTATLLADMVLKGELGLNDPVQVFLPNSVEIPQRNGDQISLVDLSTHHSALPRMPSNFSPENQFNPYADYTVQNMYDFLSGHTLTRDIGERGEYSNLGVGLLGHALMLKAGTDYEELVSERIFRPLSMGSSGITFSDSMSERLAPAYAANGGILFSVENWDLPTFAGAGAIRSTAEDMLQYLAANIGLLDSPLISAMELAQQPREDFGAENTKIGLGWIIVGEGENSYHWHNGGTGGYRSFAGISTENKRGVVVLTNSTNSPDDIGRHLLNPESPLIDAEPPKERVAISLPEEQLQKLVGSYQLAPEFIIEFIVENGRFYTQATAQPRFETFAESATEFFLKVVDAQMTFELDENGMATRVTLHQNGQNIPGEKSD